MQAPTLKLLPTRFVDVPINVQVPPRIVAKESGIKYRDGETPFLLAQSFTTGTNIATIGVLFRKAEGPAAHNIIFRSARGPVWVRPKIRFATNARAPVCCKAPAITNRDAIDTIPGLAKPAKASSVVSTPSASNKARRPKNMTYAGNVLRNIQTRQQTTPPIVIQPSQFIACASTTGIIRRASLTDRTCFDPRVSTP